MPDAGPVPSRGYFSHTVLTVCVFSRVLEVMAYFGLAPKVIPKPVVKIKSLFLFPGTGTLL